MKTAETQRRRGTRRLFAPQRFLSLSVLSLLCALAGGAGCATATARPRTDPAPLSIPEPPPRVVEPLPEVEELPAEPPRREPSAAAPPTRAARPQRENGTSAKAEPKPEPARPEPIPVEPAPAPAPPASPSRGELRTPETVNEEAAARAVRETLDSAAKLLAKVDYGSLRREGRQQYDTAKHFMEQADEALSIHRNHIAAQYLAGKAETIAKGLTGR